MKRLPFVPGRWTRGALTLMLLVAPAFVGLTAASGSAHAAANPKAGDPCTSADLGRRYPFIKSATMTPTITHFKTFFVTAGTTGQQIITLENTTVITVEVGTTTEIRAHFGITALTFVEGFVNRTVKKITASTDKEVQQITWNFLAPGYYGLFKGTRKVTGEYGSLNCTSVDKGAGQYATEWIERPGGSYTTYSIMEEGAIRCEDVVPPTSLMRLAQIQLGCDGVAAKERAERQARETREQAAQDRAAQDQAAQDQAAASEATETGRVVAPFAVPPGFACEAGYYRVGTSDRLLNWWNQDGTDEIRLRGWSTSSRAQWSLCQGPVTNGRAEHVLITRYSGKCLTLVAGEMTVEGGRFFEEDCRTVDDRQRFYLYRDVPGSALVGVQVKSGGFMLGQARVADNEVLRQYSMGMEDGTGTYLLEKIA
ncbi:hypothetical protein [Nonomuraea sp. NPDC050643]|uniref:hypothetical protein n=1 Tax=Nonomuraea sp. NPDC050643 TaxID=3155660 RepID=UPI003407BBE1